MITEKQKEETISKGQQRECRSGDMEKEQK